MAKPKAQKIYVTNFAVKGVGEFPYDMLRYDQCCPQTSEDASQMSQHRRNERVVKLVRFSGNPDGATNGRWASFGWHVVPADSWAKQMEEADGTPG